MEPYVRLVVSLAMGHLEVDRLVACRLAVTTKMGFPRPATEQPVRVVG